MNPSDKKRDLKKLRDLQGTPLAILFAMFIQQKPVNKKFLSMVLQTSYNTVANALEFLEFEGYVQRTGYRSWTLPGGQLPLPGFPQPQTIAPATPKSLQSPVAPHSSKKPGTDQAENCTDEAKICTQSGPARVFAPGVRPTPPETSKFDVSDPSTTTTTDLLHEEVVVVEAETSNFDVSADLAAAFEAAGIGRNVWPGLAALPWVTPQYVGDLSAHVHCQPDPAKRTTAFLVHCIRAGDPAPARCAECGGTNDQHAATCSHRRRKYVTGKYAGQINY